MWLLVQYIDSEFPDYDIVNKTRLLKTKYDRKNLRVVRAECDQSVHRALVIQESGHEFRLKLIKEMLLKEHREKRAAKKEWEKRKKTIALSKRCQKKVSYSSSGSESYSDSVVSDTSENRHDEKNAISNSMSCSSTNGLPSSEETIPTSGRPKVQHAATSTSCPIDSNSTHFHIECTDREVQVGLDRVTRKLEKIVAVGVPVQQEISKVMKMFQEFKVKFPEEQNESIHTSMKDSDSSPAIRRSRRQMREPKFRENNSLDSSKNSDKNFQKGIIIESAETVRRNILKVLALFNELDSYPEACMYKAKEGEVISSDERDSDLIEDEEFDV